MAAIRGRFRAGHSGNPNGRPPKSRALTEILERAGAQKMPMPDGALTERRRVLAEYLWNAVIHGEIELPPDKDGEQEKLRFSPKDWLETVKFLYQHIDGPAKPVQPIGGDEKPLKAKPINYDEIADNDPAELVALYRQEIG